jgi:hypothetical protein
MVVVMVVMEGLSLAGVAVDFEGHASMRVRRRKHVCKVGEGIVARFLPLCGPTPKFSPSYTERLYPSGACNKSHGALARRGAPAGANALSGTAGDAAIELSSVSVEWSQ